MSFNQCATTWPASEGLWPDNGLGGHREAPMTNRFEDSLDQLTKGKEPGKVRIALE